jgi:arginyl-tRNA synthetase
VIRDELISLVEAALAAAQGAGDLPEFAAPEVELEHPQRPEHGDYSANLPLRIQGLARMKAVEVAEVLRSHVPAHEAVSEVEVAPPGFLNFRLGEGWLADRAPEIAAAGAEYASADAGAGQKVQVEYLSANPTGPVHIANARGAVIGSTLANVLRAAGFDVEEEYYVNDAGTQVSIFGRTLYARYEQLFGRDAEIPENGYPGEYMVEVAQAIKDEVGERFLRPEGEEPDPALGEAGIEAMIAQIREDLTLIGVEYDSWFSERSLQVEGGPYDRILGSLRDQGHIVERDGAVWFASSLLGESKDNVLIRSDGAPTYFATDIAYHFDKFAGRGFDRVIDIWGADHQGHVSRLKSSMEALGEDPERLEVLLYQLVALRRGDEVVPLSKRAGEIVTLREVVEEVGSDATRFFFLATSPNSPIDFDIDLAQQQSDENPVYYVQYAHARIASVVEKATEAGLTSEGADTSLLRHAAELTLLRKLLLLPEVLAQIAGDLQPQPLPHYSTELAQAFHAFYTQCHVINQDDEPLSRARLLLMEATQVVLARALGLMGVAAPNSM